MPYTLFYLPDIKRGTIDYNNRTVTLSIETHLHGSGIWTLAMERTLQAVYDDLDATKRKDEWGLASWPQRGVTSLNAFDRRSRNFSVVFELLNDQNKIIGKQTLQSGGFWQLNRSGRPIINVDADDRRILNFQNVISNDISDKMIIRVTTVNGTIAETTAKNRVLQIQVSTKGEFDRNDRFRFSRGTIQGFSNDKIENLVIPSTIWGDPVLWIGDGAFRGVGLTSVTIPSSITSIPSGAFKDNKLTKITIPISVTTISSEAFINNRLISVIIPENVNFEYNAIGNGFESAYEAEDKQAGVYRVNSSNGQWERFDNEKIMEQIYAFRENSRRENSGKVYFEIGYNYIPNMPLGFTLGTSNEIVGIYTSWNIFIPEWKDYSKDNNFTYNNVDSTFSNTGSNTYESFEWLIGFSFVNLEDRSFFIMFGIGGRHEKEWRLFDRTNNTILVDTKWYGASDWDSKLVLEIGMKIILNPIYFSGTYRNYNFFKEHGYSVGAGIRI
jgi:hypothetical protein